MNQGTTCKLAECGKPVKRRGYCYGHYMKNWRYGTPTPEFEPAWIDIRGRRFGALTVIARRGSRWLCDCDCGAVATVRAGDLNSGHVSSCGDRALHGRRDDILYHSAHDRVRDDRGLVQHHACVGCGRSAQHWSYDHTDPDELLAEGLSSNPLAYSTKPEHYSPRCVRCHKRFDLKRANSTAECNL